MQTSTPPRALFCSALIILVAIAAVVVGYDQSTLPPSISVDTLNQPTIGYPKARVHVVVFEEPKCSNCRDFNNDIFPQIKKEFIETNKILYTVIPVSFLPDSMPAAIALLCAYHQSSAYPNNDLFFTFLDYLYEHQPSESSDWATESKLVELAKEASPAIQLDKLKQCVEKQSFVDEIQKNTAYGNEIMDGKLSTPTVYINGIRVEELSYSEIQSIIQEVDRRGGKV